jgi:hypothetical protein
MQWHTDSVTDPRTGALVTHVQPGTFCTQCYALSTPVWRAGPFGHKTLCNVSARRPAGSLATTGCLRGSGGLPLALQTSTEPNFLLPLLQACGVRWMKYAKGNKK